MAIIKRNFRRPYHSALPDEEWVETETLFTDRVVAVEVRDEHRNCSNTMDYSDWSTVEAVWALVWLGTRGVPPRERTAARSTTSIRMGRWEESQVRDLEFHEQFAWVDCTHTFDDINGYSLTPKVDGEYGLYGEPLMWANLTAWEAYHKALASKQAEEARRKMEAREAEEAAERAKKAAAAAKREAKLLATKAAAEGQLALIPAKGTKVTVAGFTGTVFWRGVAKYQGKFHARAGVKNGAGEVQWIDATRFIP